METKEESIFQIYDRIFKRIFNLSNLAIINLINGLFGTNYPPDSQVEYYNKEFVNSNLGKRFADIFITICGVTYHLEAQMRADKTIVLRVFEYNFYYALENQQEENVLHFSEPMVILIPFQLLKLRKLINKRPTKENFSLLHKLMMDDIMSVSEREQAKLVQSERRMAIMNEVHDIMGSVKANLQVGNITEDDAEQLRELTRQLYDNIYRHYEEMGGLEDMKPLLEGALELPLDKYRIRIDELEEQKSKLEEQRAKAEEERDMGSNPCLFMFLVKCMNM